MSAGTRELLACAADLLDQGRNVDRLSRPLTLAALIGLLVTPAIANTPPAMSIGFVTLVALAGLAEGYLAMRVGFDAALFRRLATAEPDFTDTDAALTQLGLLPAAKAGRPAEARAAGARRLLVWQIGALVAQVAAVLAAAFIGSFGR